MNEIEKINDKRIEYVDIYRGIGIILMIMGHIGFGGKFDIWIHAFHMPMFFFIAGFLHKEKMTDMKTFLKKKAKSLLLPYLTFGIFNYIIYLIINQKIFDLYAILHFVTDNTNGLPISGALWFLTALFFVDVIVFLLEKYVRNKKIKIVIIMLLMVVGNYETKLLTFRLPLSIGISFVGVGIYYIGYVISKISKIEKSAFVLNLKNYQIVILGIITTISIFLNGYVNMRMGIYKNIILYWINVIASCIILINISKKIENVNSILIKKVILVLKYVGINAITYIGLNQLVILINSNFLNAITIKYIPNIINLILTLVILFVINQLIMKSKIKKILGK